MGLHKISEDLSVSTSPDGSIILWDTFGYSPRRAYTLDVAEMAGLKTYFEDGLCPVCLDETVGEDVVCDRCYRLIDDQQGPEPEWR